MSEYTEMKKKEKGIPKFGNGGKIFHKGKLYVIKIVEEMSCLLLTLPFQKELEPTNSSKENNEQDSRERFCYRKNQAK